MSAQPSQGKLCEAYGVSRSKENLSVSSPAKPAMALADTFHQIAVNKSKNTEPVLLHTMSITEQLLILEALCSVIWYKSNRPDVPGWGEVFGLTRKRGNDSIHQRCEITVATDALQHG